MTSVATPERESVLGRNMAKIDEALGPFNRWVTGVNLGHEPSPEECLLWYIDHDGPQDYTARHPESKEAS